MRQLLLNTELPSQIGILLALLYTIGHILIAMTCNRLLTGAPLNLAVIDAFVEPVINGVWFYFLFEVFNKYKKRRILSGLSGATRMPLANSISKFAPINNKKYSDL